MPYVSLTFENDEILDAALSFGWADIHQQPPPPAVHLKGRDVEFVNIGSGPAVDIVYTFSKDSRHVSHTVPYLKSGETFKPPIGVSENVGARSQSTHVISGYGKHPSDVRP